MGGREDIQVFNMEGGAEGGVEGGGVEGWRGGGVEGWTEGGEGID